MFPFLGISKINLLSISSPKTGSRLLVNLGRRCDSALQRSVGWERWGAPVWLVKVDVESPCPAGEDPLLRDETMMAAPPPTLMRNVHSALIWTTWLVVMIGDRLVLRLPVVVVRQERQLTFKNDLISHLSFMWHRREFSILWWRRRTWSALIYLSWEGWCRQI